MNKGKKAIGHYLSDLAREAARKAAADDFSGAVTGQIKETPFFLVSEAALRRNLDVLASVKKRTGAKMLIALKAFAMHSTFPIIREYLDGVCASGPMEARLGAELFRKEVHTFSPAYSEQDIEKLIKYSDVIIFNSISQWKKYRYRILSSRKKIQVGLRVNPGYSEIETDLYNPALPRTGLGILPEELKGQDLRGIDGLHFHALLEQDADVLVRVLESFEKLYGNYVHGMKWVNLGGGHHITRPGYDTGLLVRTINGFKERYNVQVHLEPGEAVSLNAGVLVSTVLDVIRRKGEGTEGIAVLDASAENHMPDVLAMPYKPDVMDAGEPGEKKYTYTLRGPTCLAGDIIGDYSFSEALTPGDRVVFLDMALYTMVKDTTFNGIKLPSIALHSAKTKKSQVVKSFGYDDYKERLS